MKNQIKIMLGVLALAGLQAQAQVVNGGFETGDFTGWTVGAGAFDFGISTGSYYAHTGTYGVAFGQVDSDTSLSQTVATTLGDTYTLSYWLDGNGSGYSEARVFWDGTQIALQTDIASGWTEYSYSVVGTGSDTIDFGLRNDPSYDGLDDVSLTAGVPDAGSSLSLMGTALVGLCGFARRFRK